MPFRYFGTGWRVAHSIKTFGDHITELRGHAVSYLVDGTLGNLEHSNRTSDHNPDENGIVRALDFFEHKPGFVDEIAEALRASKDERLKYFIHSGEMFASYTLPGKPAWEWREYTGPNAHKDHGHLSVVATAIADQDHEWEVDMSSPKDWTEADKKIVADIVFGNSVAAQFGGLEGSPNRKPLTVHILDIKSALGAIDLEGISEAELDERVAALADMIHAQPETFITKLKAAL